MKYNNTEFTLLDTPGHVDFSAEAERTLQVLDYAILVISGTDGVQSHTCTLWKLLKSTMCRVLSSSTKWILTVRTSFPLWHSCVQGLTKTALISPIRTPTAFVKVLPYVMKNS